MRRFLCIAPVLLAALAPESASALTLKQGVGMFYLFVGLFLTAILLTFASGVFVYFARLGTWPSYRDVAIKVLEWAVAMLFVLIVILGIVRFFFVYTQTAVFLAGVLLIAVAAFYLLRIAAIKGEGGEDKH